VLMRILESAPSRYDLGIRLLTFGAVERVYDRLDARIAPGDRVLGPRCAARSSRLEHGLDQMWARLGDRAPQLAHHGVRVLGTHGGDAHALASPTQSTVGSPRSVDPRAAGPGSPKSARISRPGMGRRGREQLAVEPLVACGSWLAKTTCPSPSSPVTNPDGTSADRKGSAARSGPWNRSTGTPFGSSTQHALYAAGTREVVARVRRRKPGPTQLFRQAAQRCLVVHLEAGVHEIVTRTRVDHDALRLVVDPQGEAAVRASPGHEQAEHIDRESLPGRDVADLEAQVPES